MGGPILAAGLLWLARLSLIPSAKGFGADGEAILPDRKGRARNKDFERRYVLESISSVSLVAGSQDHPAWQRSVVHFKEGNLADITSMGRRDGQMAGAGDECTR